MRAALLTLASAAAAAGHTCVHTEVLKQLGERHTGISQLHDASTPDKHRRLAASTWAPMRMKAIYPESLTQDSRMDANKAAFIQQQLMPEAMRRWSKLLSVRPVQGNLFAHRECGNDWYSVSGQSAYVCGGYLSQTGCSNFAGSGDLNIYFSGDQLGSDTYYDGHTTRTLPAGTGTPNADFAVFVTARQTSLCGSCSGASGTLAYASLCQRDDMERPTFGRINFCACAISTDPAKFEFQVSTAMHELAHAIGFDDSNLALFRDASTPDLAPRTPRDSAYPFQPASAYYVQYSCKGYAAARFLPDPSTATYVSERGMACSWTGDQSASTLPWVTSGKTLGDCVGKVMTPALLAAARDFFDCPAANAPIFGAELENQLTSNDCAFFGSHWEQRILNSELMGSYIMDTSFVSALTLAFFEDSGWYKANYTAADAVAKGLTWGYKQGCAFATAKCSATNTGSPPHWYFDATAHTSSSGTAVCTVGRRAVGYTETTTGNSIPAQYRYWPDNSGRGYDNVPTADWCPMVMAYGDHSCATGPSGGGSYYGETFSSASVCLTSTLYRNDLTSRGAGAGCMAVNCAANSASYTVSVPSAGGSTASFTCTAEGQTFSPGGSYRGQVTCADPAAVCAVGRVYSPPPLPSPVVLPSPTPSSSPVTRASLRASMLYPVPRGGALNAAPFTLGSAAMTAAGNQLASVLGLSLASTTSSAPLSPAAAIEAVLNTTGAASSSRLLQGGTGNLLAYRVIFSIDSASASKSTVLRTYGMPATPTGADVGSAVTAALSDRALMTAWAAAVEGAAPGTALSMGYANASQLGGLLSLDPSRAVLYQMPGSAAGGGGSSGWNNLSLGAKLGIGVTAAIIALVLLYLLAVCLCGGKKRQQRQMPVTSAPPPGALPMAMPMPAAAPGSMAGSYAMPMATPYGYGAPMGMPMQQQQGVPMGVPVYGMPMSAGGPGPGQAGGVPMATYSYAAPRGVVYSAQPVPIRPASAGRPQPYGNTVVAPVESDPTGHSV